MGDVYHLRGACLVLAKELLDSQNPSGEIHDLTRTSVVRLENATPGHQFEYIEDEKCEHAGFAQDARIAILALKLEHNFEPSKTPFDIEKWQALKGEFECEEFMAQEGEDVEEIVRQRDLADEARRTEECGLVQLFNSWNGLSVGTKTLAYGALSLTALAAESLWGKAFNPEGKKTRENNPPPLSGPIDSGGLDGRLRVLARV